MTATKSAAQTVLLCAGFFAVNMVWSDDYPQGDKVRNVANPDVAQVEPPTLSASALYQFFHSPKLNEPDDLGDYVQNFQPDQPLRR